MPSGCAGSKYFKPGFLKKFVINELWFGSIEPMETTQASFNHLLQENPDEMLIP